MYLTNLNVSIHYLICQVYSSVKLIIEVMKYIYYV